MTESVLTQFSKEVMKFYHEAVLGNPTRRLINMRVLINGLPQVSWVCDPKQADQTPTNRHWVYGPSRPARDLEGTVVGLRKKSGRLVVLLDEVDLMTGARLKKLVKAKNTTPTKGV